ncbi:MAG: serine/threonine-protein phosphatase [bacterium]|nr:serine/threonine-protein phosphatase [bacterium]
MAIAQAGRMQCMEVWGGNQSVDRKLTTTGLDLWVYSQPHAASRSGGDVYYVSSCSSGRITRLLLADVSGHGEVVAARANVLRNLMRRHINRINQASLVEAINDDFESESRTGAFATAVIGTFFAPTRTLTICNAGHPSPLIYQAQNKTWIPFGSEQGASEVERNFPLGITVEQNYSNQSCKLGREDLMLCFTDGLLEFKQADGSLLGEAGLLRLLSQLDCSQPERLIPELLQRLDPNQERINAADDISLMLFQRNNERVSLYDNLAAPFRALKHFFSRKEKA